MPLVCPWPKRETALELQLLVGLRLGKGAMPAGSCNADAYARRALWLFLAAAVPRQANMALPFSHLVYEAHPCSPAPQQHLRHHLFHAPALHLPPSLSLSLSESKQGSRQKQESYEKTELRPRLDCNCLGKAKKLLVAGELEKKVRCTQVWVVFSSQTCLGQQLHIYHFALI